MTINEAINYITHHAFISDDVKEIAIEALEKQIPKKLDVWANETEHCPNCEHDNTCLGFRFCVNCGQAIDWSADKR